MLTFILLAMFAVAPSQALAADPRSDVASLNKTAQKALDEAKTGNLTAASADYSAFNASWPTVEDSVRGASRDSYRAIEGAMRQTAAAFAKNPPVQGEVVAGLQGLVDQDQAFATGSGASASPSSQSAGPMTMTQLVGQLGVVRSQAAAGQYAQAAASMKTVEDGWLDVEGQVKTRSAGDYTDTENDMALASTLLGSNSPDALPVIDRLSTRLEPYETESSYGIFDAFIILLREGLEALLVVAALLAFLKRTGNGAKQGWIWVGAGAGLAASIGLAFILQAVFSRAVTPSNREVVEGATGLVAAVMLIYVSYWMHSKSSARAWSTYIQQRTSAALAAGSLFGLALLSFLAIFREGAETALFYLGIAPSIKTSDLFIGLALAVVALGVIGFLMVVGGVRIPIAKFMMVASLLVFFLCFKFVGSGIHSLQVAGMVPTTAKAYLPSSDFLGLYPTWQSVLPQLVLLALAVTVFVRGRMERGMPRRAPASAASAAS